SSLIRRPFPRSVNAIEKVWDSGRGQMRKAADEVERLKALAREGLENAGLAESVERNYAKFWPSVRDSLLIPAGVGATAFWTATRSGQLAAYLSTITSKMPITGSLTGYSIIFGSGAVVGKTAHYLARQARGGDLDEQGSLADEFSYWDTPTTVRDGIVALLVFTMLGGTWRSVLPSSVLYRGSFWSPLLEQALPGNLRSSRGSVRHVTTTLGKSLGCHTCGSKVGPFVSDLCPPTAAISSGFGRTWLDRITGGVKQNCFNFVRAYVLVKYLRSVGIEPVSLIFGEVLFVSNFGAIYLAKVGVSAIWGSVGNEMPVPQMSLGRSYMSHHAKDWSFLILVLPSPVQCLFGHSIQGPLL
ncbi:hypothetical protein FOZ62_025039, partial [Perkinsus olseni]